MSDLQKIGALWRKQGKNGTFYSGQLDAEKVKSALAGGDSRLLLFPVKTKREKGPDVELFIAPDRDPSERSTATRPSRVDSLDDQGFGDLP